IRDPLVTGVQTCALPICADVEFQIHGDHSALDIVRTYNFVGRHVDRDSSVEIGDAEPMAIVADAPGFELSFYSSLKEAASVTVRSEERRVGKARTAWYWR